MLPSLSLAELMIPSKNPGADVATSSPESSL